VVREAQGKLTKVKEKSSLTIFHRFLHVMYSQNDAKFVVFARLAKFAKWHTEINLTGLQVWPPG
jgi:hypothetical protein